MKGSFDAVPAWLRLLTVFGVIAILAGWPGQVVGKSTLRSSLNYRLQSAVGGQCVQAINRPQGDVLVNHCDSCRVAKIHYQRRDRGFPLTRTFRVPEKGKVELSFKGSGQVRVVSDRSCDDQAQPSTGTVKNCARMAKRKNGEPVLINTCTVCRGVVVERVASSGRRDSETFALSARTLLPLPLRGAKALRIVSELPCNK